MKVLPAFLSSDASRLARNQAQYSALTTPEGTFVDDVLTYRQVIAESEATWLSQDQALFVLPILRQQVLDRISPLDEEHAVAADARHLLDSEPDVCEVVRRRAARHDVERASGEGGGGRCFFLGFTGDQINDANIFVCGAMTVEGAPHLKAEHLAVFDCANPCGRTGKRFLSVDSHIPEVFAQIRPRSKL